MLGRRGLGDMIELFLISGGLLLWNLAGYPLFLLASARRAGGFTLGADRPLHKISVLVAAHNEEGVIGARVENLLAQETGIPVEIIVASDGSTDATAAEARAAGAAVLELPRGGKIAALHAAARTATGDVLVITDANTRFEPGTAARLAAPLADSRVGIAAGDLRYEDAARSAASAGESAYWNYETALKRAASDCGLLLMGAGGVYAVRREDWRFDLAPDLADDSFVPLSLHRAGRRNVFIEDAVAWEKPGETMREEWRRRVRMVAQDVRVARSLAWGYPNPRTACAFFSQKVLRWLLLPLGAVFLCSGIPILPVRARRLVVLGAAGALLGASASPRGRRLLLSGAYLAGAVTAAFLGFCLGLSGRSPATWDVAASTRRR